MLVLWAILISCSSSTKLATNSETDKLVASIESGNLLIQINSELATKLVKMSNSNTDLTPFGYSEKVKIADQWVTSFNYLDLNEMTIDNEMGKGSQTTLRGSNGELEKAVTFQTYEKYPGVVVTQCEYKNSSSADINIQAWKNNSYMIPVDPKQTDSIPFFAYQSGAYESRADWILPLKDGFKQVNYMGMNATDYGGGTPVIDVWNPDFGIAVGHLELAPKLTAFPTSFSTESGAKIAVKYQHDFVLKPGESSATFTTFIALHEGDYFTALETYRQMMIDRGIKFDAFPETTYDPIWCAWGYERNFKIDQIYNTLPKVAEMGYKWAVLDDGYHNAEGDWELLKDKFPEGDAGMKAFTDEIRKNGLRPKLWWAPLAVDPSTALITEHPEFVLMNEDGSTQDISWWDSYYLCPAYPPVREYTKDLVTKILTTWGYDGLKIDGQHLNGAPPCYNPAHHHERPEESVEQMPNFFQDIYNTARSLKPDAVVEICPCGASYAFHSMPYFNQPVSSDPLNSWQIRLKGKTLKALMGRNAPYYGDHVELSDNMSDFASTVGVGGVVGTKFTWPPEEPVYDRKNQAQKSDIALTPEREAEWVKWLTIYNEKMLPKGDYRGELYDIGYDYPEAHAIQKDERMYYAFYNPAFDGKLQLRGLKTDQKYQVTDYVKNIDFGIISGGAAEISANFDHSLLLEAIPVND
ncbi:alpha-galactosidase [bacterium]|nr:alpha-galactosidase [bacterium]